jgi:acetolactate synthase regulatory subunit
MMYRFRYEQEEKDRKKEETLRMLQQQGFNVDKVKSEKNEYDKMDAASNF